MSHSILRKIKGQQLLWLWKQHFFEMFVSIDLWGPKEIILLIPQYWKVCLFFKHLCFQQPLRFLKKRSHQFHSSGQITLWTQIICSLRLVTLDNTEKKEPKMLVLVKRVFFETFYSIDLCGPEKTYLSCAQHLSRNLVDPRKLFPDICHVR